MNTEDYAIFTAPRGGKVDQVVDAILSERDHAYKAAMTYARGKGAIGICHRGTACVALLFESRDTIPEGWSSEQLSKDGVVSTPKAKDRTKAAREAANSLRAELKALPPFPGAYEFTTRIGSNHVFKHQPGTGMRVMTCWFDRVGDTTFVMTPWSHPKDVTGENVNEEPPTPKARTCFVPEGCTEVPLSTYFAAKERQEALVVG